MLLSARLAPPNSMVLLMDPGCGQIPDWDGQQLVMATENCILIGCLCEVDGPTEFLLGELAEIQESSTVVYDGLLSTPSKRVVVISSQNEVILEAPVNTQRTWVRIWANDPREPNRIAVGIQTAA